MAEFLGSVSNLAATRKFQHGGHDGVHGRPSTKYSPPRRAGLVPDIRLLDA